MIEAGKVLAVIPARGGSKGLPGKNIMEAAGKPLIAWTIEAARKSRIINRLVLSSDDGAIIEVAKRYGCDVPFRRSAELASDTATSLDVVLDTIDRCPGFEFVVLLQPTSPLRTSDDIDAAFKTLVESGAPACASVALVEHSPYWMYTLDEKHALRPLLPSSSNAKRRQDLRAVYTLNGAIYIANIAWLRQSRAFATKETVAYIMPAARSIDIDTAADFEMFRRTIALNEKLYA